MPPIFKQKSYLANKSSSPIGTKGAPYPLKATSKILKSETTGIKHSAAIFDAFPI